MVAKPSITESPWYWLYLFCTAGLIALIAMGPRYATRQAEIERTFQGRQRAIQNLAGEEPRTEMSDEQHTRISLQPLYYVLASLLVVAWGNLIWRHVRPRPRLPERRNS